MQPPDIWASNRVILCHFDTYSAALVFAQWEDTLLLPEGLPEAAWEMSAPEAVEPHQVSAAARETVLQTYGFKPAELVHVPQFDEWIRTQEGPLHIHLLRFTTFEAPGQAIEEHGGRFKPISSLRRADARELALLRRVFDIFIGGQAQK